MYSSNLSDQEWALLKPLLPGSNPTGRPRRHCQRSIINAIFYVLFHDCAWNKLPEDFPNASSARYYFTCWRSDGTWETILKTLKGSASS